MEGIRGLCSTIKRCAGPRRQSRSAGASPCHWRRCCMQMGIGCHSVVGRVHAAALRVVWVRVVGVARRRTGPRSVGVDGCKEKIVVKTGPSLKLRQVLAMVFDAPLRQASVTGPRHVGVMHRVRHECGFPRFKSLYISLRLQTIYCILYISCLLRLFFYSPHFVKRCSCFLSTGSEHLG